MAGVKCNIMGQIALFSFRRRAHRAYPGRDKRVNIDGQVPTGFEVVWIGHDGILPTGVPGSDEGHDSLVLHVTDP